ncbi:HEPN domain-containing protein [Microbacter margulisiae]|uniref:Uncharacterized protein (UPF0332 family) n=1 Tax=Microbacter margulisiae TaxID=1350067 RepID=A0A7W5H2B2_9PORP|nr:HEPN domain-containing protein [Microbacter margulisiae]MBB3187221.1 uncharacterized protein (UPF0332 family) [Microbacter margulisiae]
MSLSREERDAIIYYRIQKAKETLKEASGIAKLGYWNAVVNRLYYACYYMTSALLLYHGYSAQTHSGVIRLFGLNFVATGIVPKEQSKFYSKLFELRQAGDYDDLYRLTSDEVSPLIELAYQYVEVLEALIVPTVIRN